MGDKVAILLAEKDGAAFLADQLTSLVRQTHRDWELFVSMDGASEPSEKILRQFARTHPNQPVTMVRGPGLGFAQNFLSLLDHVPQDAQYIAFCDQDDVWLPNKLAHQIARLEHCSGPAMVFGRTSIADASLTPMGTSPLFTKPPKFANALVQNIGGGNTMMFNAAALELLRRAKPYAGEIVSHDWWCYQVLTASGATVIYDPTPKVLYRQHGSNEVGQNSTTLARLHRMSLLLRGDFQAWTDLTVASLAPIRSSFTDDNRRIFDAFVKARREGPLGRISGLRRSGVFRQTRASHIVLVVAFFFGLI